MDSCARKRLGLSPVLHPQYIIKQDLWREMLKHGYLVDLWLFRCAPG